MNRVATAVLLFTVALVGTESFALDRGLAIRKVLGQDVDVPTYHAFVIGVNSYKYWPDLKQARPDAQQVALLLKTGYGFKNMYTLYDEQATKAAIVAQLRKLVVTLTPQDSLLVFYSGHGHYDTVLRNGYWVPSEARQTMDDDDGPATTEWLQDITVKDMLGKIRARHILVISDSCFGGALLRGGVVDLGAKENTWYQRAIGQPCRWCIASADIETTPDDSVFAAKFIETLQYPRQSVFSGSDVAGWIKGAVAEHSGRKVVFGPLQTAKGNSLGEFVFLRSDTSKSDHNIPSPLPSMIGAPVEIQQTGVLVVRSSLDGMVSIDGGAKHRISAGSGLTWKRMSVGKHKVQVFSGKQAWDKDVRIRTGRTVEAEAVFKSVKTAPTVSDSTPTPKKRHRPRVH